jgi:F-type H+-transporting ATPase subunit a
LFNASKFHHGTASYSGFIIGGESSKYPGKIVETQSDGSEVRPFDISITKNVVSLFTSILLLLLIFLSIAKRYKEDYNRSPKGIQSWLEPVILFIRDDVVKSSIGEEKYRKYLPYLLTAFFFILINNLMGLVPIIPGGANLTGNVAVTMVLALITFITIMLNGSKDYYMHIVNAPGVPWWLKFPLPLMPFVEIIGVFTKPFVLMVRLFANITAGHIIALGFYSLIFIFGEKSAFAGYGVSVVTILFTVFMGLLEILVAFIQAYVFTLLSALYIGMAVEQHEAHGEKAH